MAFVVLHFILTSRGVLRLEHVRGGGGRELPQMSSFSRARRKGKKGSEEGEEIREKT